MHFSIHKNKFLIPFFGLLMCSFIGIKPKSASSDPCAYSDECPYEQICCEEGACDQECATTIDCPPECCGYNAAVLFNPCACTNLYTTGAFLYWRASGDYLTEAFLDTSFSPDPNNQLNFLFNGRVVEPNFEYKPGFSVGLGYKFGCDQWDLYGNYTRFHSTVDNFIQAIPGSEILYATWLTFASPVLLSDVFQSVSSAWTIDLDFVDAELGRNFFLGRCLTFRPSLGLRALWITQKYDLTYVSSVDEVSVDSFNKSSSWGIGPRINLHNTWNFCAGFKIFGDLGLSILHIRDKINVEQVNPILEGINNNVAYKNKQTLVTIKPIIDLSIGGGWGSSFWCDRFYFDISASYDFSIYYNQGSIQLGHAPLVVPGQPFQVVVGSVSTGNSNLSIEGLNVTVRLNF